MIDFERKWAEMNENRTKISENIGQNGEKVSENDEKSIKK